MTFEDEQKLLRTNEELTKQVGALTDALKKATETTEPKHVSQADLESGRVLVSPEDIVAGRVIIDMPDGEPKEEVKLKEGQISRNDPNLGKYMQEIAAGKLQVV